MKPHSDLPRVESILDRVPTQFALLDPSFGIVAVSEGYSRATMRQCNDLLGRSILECFPDDPANSVATAAQNLEASLRKVLLQRTDDIVIVRLRIPQSDAGRVVDERSLRCLNSPLLDADGKVIYIIHRIEDFADSSSLDRSIHGRTERERLEREVLEIASDERQRIGQELHDSVAQELAAINMQLGELSSNFPGDATTGRKMLERIVRRFRATLTTLRGIMCGLVPVAVDPGTLAAALAGLAERTNRGGGPTCTFDCPDAVSVRDNRIASQLYLIAQEAVRNAIKHGRPRHIEMTLESQESTILRIDDDGAGMPINPIEGTGLGLRIMRNRAETIGATLIVERAGATGTRVTCVLPRAATM